MRWTIMSHRNAKPGLGWLVAVTLMATVADSACAQFIPPTGLQLWLNASTLSGTDGQPIDTWSSGTFGSGLSFTQSGTANQPTFVSSAINGQPALNFSGSQFLASGTGAGSWRPSITGTGMTIFAVTQYSVGSGDDVGGWFGNDDNRVAFGANVANAASPTNAFWAWTPYNSFTYGQTNSLNTSWNVQNYVIPNTTETDWQWYLNGTISGSAALTSYTPLDYSTDVPLYVGTSRGANERWTGRIAEIMIFDGTLSQADRDSVTTYLGDKYAIVVVPEPASLVLSAAACLAAAAASRRWLSRRKK